MLWTNRGKFLMLDWVFGGETLPSSYFVALVTADVVPTVDTNTLGQLTEIADGNGYTEGGYEIWPGDSTDRFDVYTEDDTNNRASVQIKDLIWTATGGTIPDSGDGARYAVLTDDNAVVASRQIIAVWDLVSDRTATVGHVISLEDCELRLVEP